LKDDEVTRRIKKDCLFTIVKMVLSITMFAIAGYILKYVKANDTLGLLVMSILLVVSSLFPVFSIFRFFCVSFEMFFELIKKVILERDFHALFEKWKIILESKFGWKVEENVKERFFKRWPIIGPRITEKHNQEVDKRARGILFHSAVYLITMIVFWVIYKSVVLPRLLIYSTGENKIGIYWDLLKFALLKIREFIG